MLGVIFRVAVNKNFEAGKSGWLHEVDSVTRVGLSVDGDLELFSNLIEHF